jgi:NADH-quinone oxidoreductase subunit M
VAVLLVGVLDKVATFGILRYCLPLFPEAARWFAPAALALAVIGVIYAALLAVGQNDLKRLVAYTSIAHFGFIGVGIFTFTTLSGTGAVLYMVNHGLATGLLFLVVGMLAARRGSALISDFGGAGRMVPLLAGVLLFAGLASLSLPGLAPFVSEFLVLAGAFTVNPTVAVIATLGIVLAAAYVLWMVQRTTHGPLNPGLAGVSGMKRDLSLREKAVVGPLIILIIFFGLYPKPLTDVITPAVEATLADIGATDPAPTVQTVPTLEGQP